MHVFRDRADAGRQLAQRFDRFSGRNDVVVLALPRGGVPVAYEIANRIGAPLDVLIVRKLGVPGQEELAMGAIASGGIRVLDDRAVRLLGLSDEQLDDVIAAEQAELERREKLYRTRSAGSVAGKIVILVDDGLATGATMAAAIDAVRTRAPARVIVAVPVAPPEICQSLGRRADAMVCLVTPEHLYAVGVWYEDFTQTTDDEVRGLLDLAERDREMQLAATHYEGAR
jgi:predicted phosphoribosyltransferase